MVKNTMQSLVRAAANCSVLKKQQNFNITVNSVKHIP